MTPELTALALAALLQVAQFGLMAIPANIQLGTDVTSGPRDDMPVLHGLAGRLHRAMNNHFEGLILFTIAVVVITLGGKSTGFTETCAWVYLVARCLYVPAYASGIPYLRSLIWFAGFFATVAILIVAVL